MSSTIHCWVWGEKLGMRESSPGKLLKISDGGPMELKLKSISPESVDAALSKAELYRLLNEPEEAESICQDVLVVQPGNQVALRLLGLAITDQFTGNPADRYERLYYLGILYERRAKAQLRVGRPPHTLLVLLDEAMRCYQEAEKIRP